MRDENVFALTLLVAAHFVADYPLQGDFLARRAREQGGENNG